MQEAEEQVLSRTASEIPSPREKNKKIPREEDSPSITEVSAKEFKIYSKKTKTSSKVDCPPLEESHRTIVFSGLHTLKFGSNKTNSLSSSTTKENTTTKSNTLESFTEPR